MEFKCASENEDTSQYERHRRCCYEDCLSRRGVNKQNLSFHKLPVEGSYKVKITNASGQEEEVDARQEWLKRLNIPMDDRQNLYVCSLHFDATDYDFPEREAILRKLRPNAVPKSYNASNEDDTPSTFAFVECKTEFEDGILDNEVNEEHSLHSIEPSLDMDVPTFDAFDTVQSAIDNDNETISSESVLGLSRRSNSKKRSNQRTERDSDENDEEQGSKRSKQSLKSDYHYESLFVNQEQSDLTVVARGQEWKLHKNYLCQSSYFADLFEKSWKEGEENIFTLEIADENITRDALHTTFASFYQEAVDLDAENVLSVLATASLFNLNDLLKKCGEIMQNTTNLDNVWSYYQAGLRYDTADSVKYSMIQWFSTNFIDLELNCSLLREITPELMVDIINHPFLVTIDEWHVYKILKAWIFLKVPSEAVDIEGFYSNPFWIGPLLLTEIGSEFVAPFKALKLKYLLHKSENIEEIESDGIFPINWVNAAFKDLWKSLIRIQSTRDQGPQNNSVVSEEKFEKECFRTYLGPVTSNGESCDILSLQMFGMEFQFRIEKKALKVKRTDESRSLKSRRYKRILGDHNLMFRVVLHSTKSPKEIYESNVTYISIRENEERVAWVFNKKFSPPFVMYLKILFHTPM